VLSIVEYEDGRIETTGPAVLVATGELLPDGLRNGSN
jgi:hypothetical protein